MTTQHNAADTAAGLTDQRRDQLTLTSSTRMLTFYFTFQAMGFPVEMLPVLFAPIGRMAGWLAQWREGRRDAEQRIASSDLCRRGAHTSSPRG
jgi:citrate synthase